MELSSQIGKKDDNIAATNFTVNIKINLVE